jgi:structural maintenance of chromosome 1
VTVNCLRGKIDNFEAAVEKLQSEVQTIKDRRNAGQDSVRQITGEIDGRGEKFPQIGAGHPVQAPFHGPDEG